MGDSVRLNPSESFLVTLSSISSETWEMYCWATPGSSAFCDWVFLVFSGVSLETATNFLLFLKIAMILRKKFCQLWRLNWFFQIYYRSVDLLLLWGKSFKEGKQLTFPKTSVIPKAIIYLIIIALSFLPFTPFPWRETKLFTRQIKVKLGKSTLIYYLWKTNANSGGKKRSNRFSIGRN